MLETNSDNDNTSAKPFIKVLLYKCVILQMRVRLANTIDFRTLPRRKFFVGIKTPTPFEQALAPQNLMNTGNASSKIVNRIEDSCIRVCDLLGERQKFPGNLAGMVLRESQMGNGSPRPHCPMPKQTAGNSNWFRAEVELRQQIVEDVVIVPRVKRDLAGAA